MADFARCSQSNSEEAGLSPKSSFKELQPGREPRPPTDCRNALRFEDGDDLVRARIDDEDVVAD
jgi:hypothetical protein